MTSHRADDFTGDLAVVINTSQGIGGRVKEADGTLSDTDDQDPEGQEGQATSNLRGLGDQNRWHYYHVSTP